MQDKKAEIANEEQMNEILKSLEGVSYQVISVSEETKENAITCFTTSSMLQEANQRKLGYTSKRTMQFTPWCEGKVFRIGSTAVGIITYMRTDSVRIAPVAQRRGTGICLGTLRERVLSGTAEDF